MTKRTVMLLFATLVLGICFNEQVEANVVIRQGITPVNIATPLSITHSLDSDTSDSNPFPKALDITIPNRLSDGIQQMYWMQLARYPEQINGFTRTGHGVKVMTNHGYGLAQQGGQSKLATPESLSGGITTLSPQNLILRL